MPKHVVSKKMTGFSPDIIACTVACAATGIELAETVVLYAAWLAWCVGTFCDD
jgi:hypothetical protein